MKALIGCERHGRVRDAFIKRGHDAVSCDTQESTAGEPHIQDDVLKVARSSRWDIGIFFPPCTYLTKTGLFWNEGNIIRQTQTRLAVEFVRTLLNLDIPKIGLENPPGRIGTAIRPASQTIQPYEFGDPVKKTTSLWIVNLPLLVATNMVEPEPDVTFLDGTKMSKWYAESWNLPPREREPITGGLLFKELRTRWQRNGVK